MTSHCLNDQTRTEHTIKQNYYCPMCPSVSSDKLGTCPMCGMALSSLDGSFDDHQEKRSMLIRFIGSAVFAAIVFATKSDTVAALLSTLTIVLCCWPIFKRAFEALKCRTANMFTLISLGVGASYSYSMIAVLLPSYIPESFHNGDGSIPLYFNSVMIIVVLVFFGQLLELYARSKTKNALADLASVSPSTAFRLTDDMVAEEVLLETILCGDRLHVRSGDRVPLDGVIVEGSGLIDESMMTGESMLCHKESGDIVLGATINTQGNFSMEVTRIGKDTLLARVIASTKEAIESRAPIQKTVDNVASVLVPLVLLASVMTAMGWILFGPMPVFVHAMTAALSVLLIACPCAIGLATPMSMKVSLGVAADHGLLIRDVSVLELLQRADILVTDKTGTLTEGAPRVMNITSPTVNEEELLRVVASVEESSEHSIARVLVAEAQTRGIVLEKVTSFKSVVGRGVSGVVGQQKIHCGNRAFFVDENIVIDDTTSNADVQQGHTVIFVAIENIFVGTISIYDPLRDSSYTMISALKELGLHVVLATGDGHIQANVVSEALSIDETHAELLPDDKMKLVTTLQHQGHVVMMVGDGINDAPSLAAADIGIAVAKASDISRVSADIVLLHHDLMGIVKAKILSLATMRNLRHGLIFAFGYNLIAIPLAAGLFYPWFGILLTPEIATAAMSMSSVAVIFNALLLGRINL